MVNDEEFGRFTLNVFERTDPPSELKMRSALDIVKYDIYSQQLAENAEKKNSPLAENVIHASMGIHAAVLWALGLVDAPQGFNEIVVSDDKAQKVLDSWEKCAAAAKATMLAAGVSEEYEGTP